MIFINPNPMTIMTMFCFQCEQTAGGKGCTATGVCGKKPSAAKLQDEIVQAVKEIGFYNNELRKQIATIPMQTGSCS